MVSEANPSRGAASSSPPAPPDAADVIRLAPFLLGRARRGIVGSSRYALQLRDAIRSAAADPEARPVLISGEPGLEKDNIAALVHFGSAARQQLMVRLNGALLRPDGAELFAAGAGAGSSREAPPLLECLGQGALLLDQFDRVPPELRPALQELVRSGRWTDSEGVEHRFAGRVFLTAETTVPDIDPQVRQIRVPPLRVRRQDLGEWLRYGVRQRALSLGWHRPPLVGQSLVKRLQSHDFPGNLRELSQLIERALRQCSATRPAELPEDVFWTERRNPPARFDLWRWKPVLREWMRSPRLWNGVLFGLVSWLFVLVNLWLWLGPQDRAHNGALNLFWAWWWPLILLTYPLVGRLWCSFCPFMVWGEIAQQTARSLGWHPSRWPRGDIDRWAAPALAAGFAAILLWEELADLPDTAHLSSLLLLLITAGAVIGSLRFEKRFWCRHLCPVGGMNGLFAKLAISELRAQAGTCSGSCTTYACFRGGPAEGEGMATAGCPLGTHPAHLHDNRNCVLCLTCAQACPHRSVQLRLRPPAADLQRDMQPPEGETGLILVLAGGVLLHHGPKLLGWLPQAPASLHTGPLLPRLVAATVILALPSAAFLIMRGLTAAVASARWPAPRQRLLLYAQLPLLWALMLAHFLPLGMGESGLLLPVSLAPLGASVGGLPRWSADPHVVAFCQTFAIALGTAGSLVLLRRLLQPSRPIWLALSLATLVLGGAGRWLVAA